MPRRSPVPWVLAAVGAAPWSWYLVRDIDARMDALALLWPVVAVAGVGALGLAAVIAWRREPAFAALSWMLAFLVVVVGPWRPLGGGGPTAPLRVAAANTLGSNRAIEAVAGDIAGQHPDVVVVSEVSNEVDADLRARFDHAVRSTEEQSDRRGDVGVYSDRPLRALSMPASLRRQRGTRVVVGGPGQEVVLYAMHLQKPGADPSSVEVGFRTHRRIVDQLVAAVATEHRPVIVAGDLNLSDRTTGYRALTGALDDAMRAGWSGPTSRKRFTRVLLARIDHIFMPEGWCSAGSDTFDLHGSDHRGVVTSVGRCR